MFMLPLICQSRCAGHDTSHRVFYDCYRFVPIKKALRILAIDRIESYKQKTCDLCEKWVFEIGGDKHGTKLQGRCQRSRAIHSWRCVNGLASIAGWCGGRSGSCELIVSFLCWFWLSNSSCFGRSWLISAVLAISDVVTGNGQVG